MSLETRTSALFKRAEQLRRWEDSDTNRATLVSKTKTRKVKFSIGCVFLAACAAGEKEKVLSLLQQGADIDTSNVDGLTALHQACIDDNLDMVEFLVENGADVNRGDNEGWTPLHATASCGFLSIAKYLIENGADVSAVNNDGDLALDIAECDAMDELLQTEIQERGIDCDEARCQEQRRMLKDAKDWAAGLNVECVDVPHPKTGATALHVAAAKGYIDVINVLLKNDLVDVDRQDVDGWTPLHAAVYWGQREAASILVENLADMEMKNYVGQTPFDLADTDMFRHLEDLRARQSSLNKEQILRKRQAKRQSEAPAKIKKVELEIEKERQDENEDASSIDSNVEKKNRVNAISATIETNRIYPPGTTEQNNISRIQAPTTPPKVPDNNTEDTGMGDKEPRSPTSPTARNNIDSDVVLRRTYSFENDEKRPSKDLSLDTSNIPVTSTTAVQTITNSATNASNRINSGSPTPTSPPPSAQVRRSFVPPVRDEESETQRKAHAKRVRETRRSTQGVTLDEIKSAEQLVKKKSQPTNTPAIINSNSTDQNNTVTSPNGTATNGAVTSISATITTGAPTVVSRDPEDPPNALHERRPSWRMRVGNGSKFKLEDASLATDNLTVFVRRTGGGTTQPTRPSSAPVEPSTPPADTVVTLPLRRNSKSIEDKEQDKENDIRNAQATQAVIQRRRRPKRRSTGVVHVDMDEIDPDKQDSNAGGDCDEIAKTNHEDSESDKNSIKSSRLESLNNIPVRNENGEIDYKKLWEQVQTENERLREKLRKSDEELRDTKQTLERITSVTSKNSLSELEKREKRAMERKLSEMEEELKQLEALKTENQRLKDENGALIRVVSKLSK